MNARLAPTAECALSEAPIGARVDALDWNRIADDLDAHGNAVAPALLSSDECAALAAGYDADEIGRAHV